MSTLHAKSAHDCHSILSVRAYERRYMTTGGVLTVNWRGQYEPTFMSWLIGKKVSGLDGSHTGEMVLCCAGGRLSRLVVSTYHGRI